MKVTNPSFLTSLSGVLLATAGLAIATSAPSKAETFSIHPEEKISTEQQFVGQLLKDDDKDDDDDDDDKVPANIKRSILEKISEQTGAEIANLRIVKLETKTWSDGCLGLGEAGTTCTQAMVPGWLAVVAHNDERMVYRTDAIGSQVMLDKMATAMVSRTVTETTTRTTTETRSSSSTVNTSTQAQAETYSTTAQMQNSYTGFTLGIWQPSGKLANVIARVSLKEKTDSGYAAEKLLGDYKYKINKKAKFKKVKAGDRVVVRLYDLKNSLIGYSQFEVLSQYTAVNLILSSQPTQYRVVRTVCGVDADDNGVFDSDSESYSYYTQVTGAAGQRRVTFLSESSEIQVSQFQVSGFSSATTIAYPASFTSGEYTLSSQTMDVFSSDLDTTLISLPGTVRQIVAINANNTSAYDVTMLSTNTTIETTTTTAFSDVAKNYWANKFIVALAEKKIIEGYPDGLYRPERPVTRAEFATMLSKAFQMMSKTREAIAFTDVSSDYWAYQYIQQAYEMGFLSSFSGNEFNPKQNLTRLDILMALVKGLNYSSTTSTTQFVQMYSDVRTMSSDMRTVLAAATERGIVVNYPDVKKFKAKKVATRAEVAAFIYQAMVSNGQVANISSPYVVGDKVKVRGVSNKKDKRHCNQGIGNGAEGCDPGNSRPHGGSNDEGGRTPGGRNR